MRKRVLSIGAAALCAATAGAAQDVPVETLSAPVASYPEGLGSLRGVRELPDGRVLIADGLGEALIAWSPGAGADTLGNVGEGPEEYRVPDGLWPLPDGGTLLVDIGNARLVELDADLSFRDTHPIALGAIGPGMTLLIPNGTDREGHIYYRQRLGMIGADSGMVARYDPDTEETEELGTFDLPELQIETSGGQNDRREMVRPLPLRPQDAWGVAWDGRVAAARAGGYRLDWLHPDGRVVSGPEIEVRPVRVGAAEKEAWLEGLGGGLGVMVTQTNQGAPRLSFRRGGPEGEMDPDDFDWPEVKPPFPADAVRVDREGRAWVLRHGPAGEPPLYDVFDADARRIAQIRLPEGRTLAGFGEDTVYLVRSDAFDFAWLEAYAAPDLET